MENTCDEKQALWTAEDLDKIHHAAEANLRRQGMSYDWEHMCRRVVGCVKRLESLLIAEDRKREAERVEKIKNARAVMRNAFVDDPGFKQGYIANVACVLTDCIDALDNDRMPIERMAEKILDLIFSAVPESEQKCSERACPDVFLTQLQLHVCGTTVSKDSLIGQLIPMTDNVAYAYAVKHARNLLNDSIHIPVERLIAALSSETPYQDLVQLDASLVNGVK